MGIYVERIFGTQCKAIFYHGFKSSIRHVHTHLPTPCFNIALSMSGRQWESWTYFYFIVFNMWTQHKLFNFHGPVTLLHLFLVSWFKKKKKKSYLEMALSMQRTTIINCTHVTIIIIQFKEWGFYLFIYWEEYCRIKVVTKCLSLRDLMRDNIRSCQVAL